MPTTSVVGTRNREGPVPLGRLDLASITGLTPDRAQKCYLSLNQAEKPGTLRIFGFVPPIRARGRGPMGLFRPPRRAHGKRFTRVGGDESQKSRKHCAVSGLFRRLRRSAGAEWVCSRSFAGVPKAAMGLFRRFCRSGVSAMGLFRRFPAGATGLNLADPKRRTIMTRAGRQRGNGRCRMHRWPQRPHPRW